MTDDARLNRDALRDPAKALVYLKARLARDGEDGLKFYVVQAVRAVVTAYELQIEAERGRCADAYEMSERES